MATSNASPTSPVPSLLTADQGIAPYLLQHVAVGIKDNDPSTKITPTGFLKMALENTPDMGIPDHEKLRLNSTSGLYSDVKLWYYQRPSPADVDTTLDCTMGYVNERAVFDLTTPFVASRTIQFSNSDLAQYTEDAIQTVKLGKAPTPFMEDVFKQIMIQCNAIAGKINTDLLGAVTFGRNVASGNSGTTATTLNINKDATKFDLSQGIPKLLADAQINQFNGDVLIVGAGLMLSYEENRKSAQNMLNGQSIQGQSGYQFYKDFYVPSASAFGAGANNIGVFAPGTIGFIDLNTMVGFREQNLGVFQSFQIPLPVYNSNGESTIMMFDVRMRFNSCPGDVATGPYGTVHTIGEGWSIQISKQYGLFQTPTDMYPSDTTDPLHDTNGALLYSVTNVSA